MRAHISARTASSFVALRGVGVRTSADGGVNQPPAARQACAIVSCK
jgi:hypothetical protein